MAGVILKDKNGNADEYSDVKKLEVPYKEADGSTSKLKYTATKFMRYYVASQQSNGAYLIQKSLSYINTNDISMFSVGESECREFGKESSTKGYELLIIGVAKDLTVGNSYMASDMY
jgi:hypothetical protein